MTEKLKLIDELVNCRELTRNLSKGPRASYLILGDLGLEIT